MTDHGLIEVSRTATSPMLLPEAKSHLRIIGNDGDDLYIQSLIDTAEALVEEQTLIAIRRKVYIATFPSFVTTQRNMQNLRLFRNPVVSIDAITMTDIDNIPQIVTEYQSRVSRWPATLAPIAGRFWPLSKYRTMEAISVRFTAGFSSNDRDPRFLKCKLAMRYLLSHMYENREIVIADSGAVPYEMPYTLKPLINSLRYGGFL